MTTTREIMRLVDAYGQECCKGNEYDNRYMETSARHRILVALKEYAPQRNPLTDEEIILIVAECAASHQHTDIHFARAIERAHGIKELV